ncbi:hypothetical protein ACLOJK_016278 [Asimina triloba]
MQPTLIIWGEEDRIFPLELAHRLNRLLEGNSELVVIKHAGHAVNLEKTKEFCKHLKAFLIDTLPQSNSTKTIFHHEREAAYALHMSAGQR